MGQTRYVALLDKLKSLNICILGNLGTPSWADFKAVASLLLKTGDAKHKDSLLRQLDAH